MTSTPHMENASASTALVPVVNGEILPPEPALNRRRVLRGMALSVPLAASAVVLLPSDVAAAPVPAEDPELFRLIDEMREVRALYNAAWDARAAAWRAWSPHWPAAPDEIAGSYRNVHNLEGPYPVYFLAEHETTLDGSYVQRPDWDGDTSFSAESRWRHVIERGQIEKAIAKVERGLGYKRTVRSGKYNGVTVASWEGHLARYRALLPIVNAYHDECDRIREAAGYDAHHRERERQGDKLVEIIVAIMALEPKTMAGVLIQAEAMNALDRTDHTRRIIAMMRHEQAPGRLAKAILRIAQAGSAVA